MSKHNKKRNTAFIYEALVREVAKQSMDQNEEQRDTAIKILKEWFRKNTSLRKELDLYKTLLETKNLSERMAEKLIYESLKQHRKIDQNKLFEEQSALISLINKKLSKDVFLNFVPNYKDLATISQIFSDSLKPKSKVILETKILHNLIQKREDHIGTAPVANVVVRSFIKRFNDTYTNLFKEQKDLLKDFIKSFADNGTEFKFYLNEELGRLKKVVKDSYELSEVQKDEALKTKLNQVTELLENFNQRPLNREGLMQVLKIQNLAQELTSE